jgi:hypothetical protein
MGCQGQTVVAFLNDFERPLAPRLRVFGPTGTPSPKDRCVLATHLCVLKSVPSDLIFDRLTAHASRSATNCGAATELSSSKRGRSRLPFGPAMSMRRLSFQIRLHVAIEFTLDFLGIGGLTSSGIRAWRGRCNARCGTGAKHAASN